YSARIDDPESAAHYSQMRGGRSWRPCFRRWLMADDMSGLLYLPLYFLCFFVVLLYFISPLMIWKRFYVAARPPLRPLAGDGMNLLGSVAEFQRDAVSGLIRMGFIQEAATELNEHVRNMRMTLVLLRDPNTGVRASVGITF